MAPCVAQVHRGRPGRQPRHGGDRDLRGLASGVDAGLGAVVVAADGGGRRRVDRDRGAHPAARAGDRLPAARGRSAVPARHHVPAFRGGALRPHAARRHHARPARARPGLGRAEARDGGGGHGGRRAGPRARGRRGAARPPRGARRDPPGGTVTALADGEWQRLHLATPLLRGGIALIAILGIVITNLRERLFEWLVPGFDCPPGMCEEDPISIIIDRYLLIALLGLAVLLVVIIALFWLSWRMHTFRVTDEVVEVRSGVLFRSHRKARLDRIQGVSISRSLFARIFGAAKLEISAAGAEANVVLAYLSGANADGLRAEILTRASGIRAREAGAAAAPAQEAPEEVRANLAEIARARRAEFTAPEVDPNLAPPQSVVTMSVGRLVGSTLLSTGTIIFVLAIAGALVAIGVGGAGGWVLFGLIPTFFGFGTYLVNRVVKSLRYSIAATPDGVRVGFGLLSTTNETLPPGRIHAVEVSQDLLWRGFDWWTVRINLASQSLS